MNNKKLYLTATKLMVLGVVSGCSVMQDYGSITHSTNSSKNFSGGTTPTGHGFAIHDPGAVTPKVPVGPSLANEIAPNYAVAYLPNSAGQLTSVRQTSGKGRVHQTVLYKNAGYGGGENQIIVDVSSAKSAKEYFQPPSRRVLHEELSRFFPTMKMTIDEVPRYNLHGVYGYASGTSKIDGNCIFAWQVIRNVTRQDAGDKSLKWFKPSYAAKLRVRYCHPTKPVSQLLALTDGLQVKPMTASTLEMLRFAEGAGYQAPLAFTPHVTPVNIPAQTPIQTSALSPAPSLAGATGVPKPVIRQSSERSMPRKIVKAIRNVVRRPKADNVTSNDNAPRIMLPTELGANVSESEVKVSPWYNSVAQNAEQSQSAGPAPLIPLPR